MIVLLAVTDVVWNGLIAGVVALGLAWIQVQNARVATAAAAATAATVNANAVKLKEIEKTGNATLELVNGAMMEQLKLNASVTKRLALVTKDPEDEAVAKKSEKLFHQHLELQKKMELSHSGKSPKPKSPKPK